MVQSGGVARKYRLHIPRGYDNKSPTPIVLMFHGTAWGIASPAEDMESYTGLVKRADAGGFIAVTPEGVGDPVRWSGVTGAGPIVRYASSVTFVGDLLNQLSGNVCIDPARIYAAGFSDGAGLAFWLGCELPGRFAAVGVVSGMTYPMAMGADFGTACPAPHSPVIAFHGTADPNVPFTGGLTATGPTHTPIPNAPWVGVRTTLGLWARANGCSTNLVSERKAKDVLFEKYPDCKGGADVEMYVIEGGGHVWPGASVEKPPFGKTTHSINATDLMWEFFVAHALSH